MAKLFFLNGCAILLSHQQCVREGSNFCTFVSILVIVCLFIIVILEGVKCYLIVVLVYISLITNDFEHLLMYLWSICVSSLDNSGPLYIFKIFIFYYRRYSLAFLL